MKSSWTITIALVLVSSLAWAVEALPLATQNSLEFEYPIFIGLGMKYEHIMGESLAFMAEARADVIWWAPEASAQVGVTYYLNEPFQGLYTQAGAGYLFSVYPDFGESPLVAIGLGWKSADRGWFWRPEIALKLAPALTENPVLAEVSLGLGGNW
jgi:hypothetical protein